MKKERRLTRSDRWPMKGWSSDGPYIKTVSSPAWVLERDRFSIKTGRSGGRKAV